MSGGGRARILAALGVAVAALLATVVVVVVNRDELVALLPLSEPEPPAPEATVLGYWGGKIDASVLTVQLRYRGAGTPS